MNLNLFLLKSMQATTLSWRAIIGGKLSNGDQNNLNVGLSVSTYHSSSSLFD